MMNLEIKPLSSALFSDFFEFFDNRAFSDHKEWSCCYCTWFHMDKAHENQVAEEVKADRDEDALRRSLRNTALSFLNENTLRGYLAYADGVPAGWCNANDKAIYRRFDFHPETTDFIRGNSCGKTISVVCFAIAPEYRGKGVAAALLESVVRNAGPEGYNVVEGYPRLRDDREPFDYNGPLRLWEKAGFMKVAEKGNVMIMRKVI